MRRILQNRLQRYYKFLKNTNYLVKKRLTYLVLLLMLLFSGSLMAEINHFAGISLNAGEWSLLPLQKSGANIVGTPSPTGNTAAGSVKYKPSLGAAGGLAFQYELQYKAHAYSPASLLFDIGLGAEGGWTSYLESTNMLDSVTGVDFDGSPLWYFYDVQNRHDQYINVAVQIPIMIGVQYRHFYGLAGVKVYANTFTKTRSTGELTTFARFDDVTLPEPYTHLSDFRDMPEYQFVTGYPIPESGLVTRGLVTDPTTGKKSFTMDIDIAASLELGYRLGFITDEKGFDIPKRKTEYRIAAFADFGIFDWHKAGNEKAVIIPGGTYNAQEAYSADGSNKSMLEGVVLNDIMQTPVFADKIVHNLIAGIKFTILFELPKPGECVICRDSYQSTAKLGGRGRGVKYEEE